MILTLKKKHCGYFQRLNCSHRGHPAGNEKFSLLAHLGDFLFRTLKSSYMILPAGTLQNGRLKNARKNELKKIEDKFYKKNEKEIHEKLAK